MDTMDEKIKFGLDKLGKNIDNIGSKAKGKIERKLTSENSLLLIIDIQEKLAPVVLEPERVTKNTNILLEASHILDLPVIVTEQYPDGLGPTLDEIRDYYGSKTRVFSKVEFSAYENKLIKEEIDKNNRPNIIILGMETHICVYQTARDLELRGYNTYIVRDGVSSRTEENKENGLELIRSYGGKITNTETVLFELLGKAGTRNFKLLSPLIK